MNRTATTAVFAALALSLGVRAATASDTEVTKETVWVVQISGIGGWSAAKKAKGARAALSKMDGVESVIVDTTARGILRMKAGKTPTVAAINKALGKKLKVRKVTKSEVQKPAEVYLVKVKGLGWQSTAKSIRAMLEKRDDVIAAYPHGDTKQVEILTSKKAAFTEDSVSELIEKNRKFTVKSFATKKVASSKVSKKGRGKVRL